jgi:hypothetical protein
MTTRTADPTPERLITERGSDGTAPAAHHGDAVVAPASPATRR